MSTPPFNPQPCCDNGGGGEGVQSNLTVSDVVCATIDGVMANVVRQVLFSPLGVQTSVTFVGADGTVVVPDSWVPGECPVAMNDVILCDLQGDGSLVSFLRKYVQTWSEVLGAQVTELADFTLASPATPYTVTGTVTSCTPRDSESVLLCDSAVVPVRFLRTYVYAPSGAVVSFFDTTLAGAPFVPTGAVGACVVTTSSTDFDFLEEVLCDSNGTAFIRRFTFNSSTGAVSATADLTFAGGVFVPVGAVGTCPSTHPVVTLTAEARAVTNATPWTPGADVVGTLTSVTATGILGLWDLVDASGTAVTGLPVGLTLSWDAEDANTLTGPQSITPQAGSTVIVNWSRK